MSTFLHTNEITGTKILYGSNTDVSHVTIVKMGRDLYIETTYFVDCEIFIDKSVEHRIMNFAEFEENFKLQYGSPMQYISKENYLEFINQTW